MGVLDDLIKVGENGELIYNQWIEWDHFLIPNKPEWLREILRNIMALFGHCMNCSAIDGCYLITRNMPDQPLHFRCDCGRIPISQTIVKGNANAECDIRKFTEYVFKSTEDSKGKNKIFYNLGFSIKDSSYLQAEYKKQALNQYLKGNYVLRNLDRRGQRLAIPVSFNGVGFYSGWMLCPEGKIKNTTPFGGWIK